MKRVVLSQRVDQCPDRDESRDALDLRLTDFLLAAGCLPFPVPNRLVDSNPADALDRWIAAVRPEALVLSGGNDIGLHLERDRTERHLLAAAEAGAWPVLGICRGMQMIGVHAGAALCEAPGHRRVRHRLLGAAADTMERETNSFHAFSLASCPQGFEVLARSGDGQIEAIRHRARRWEGWMWHPEREARFDPRDLARLRALFGTAQGADAVPGSRPARAPGELTA